MSNGLSRQKFEKKYELLFSRAYFHDDTDEKKKVSNYCIKNFLNNENHKFYLQIVDDMPRDSRGNLIDYSNKLYLYFENVSDFDYSKIANIPFTIDFKECDFKYLVLFDKSTRFQEICFHDCTFFKGVFSYNNEFKFRISFYDSTFNEDFSKTNCIFENRLEFIDCIFEQELNFAKSTFLDLVTFRGVEFKTFLPDLTNCIFKSSPNLTTFIFSDKKIISHTDKMIINNSNLLEIASRHRALKKISQENQDHLDEIRYFALENKTFLMTKSNLEHISSRLYWFSSNYGQSFIKPCLILVYFFLAFGLINTLNANEVDDHCGDYKKNIVLLTLNNSLPFGLGFSKESLSCAYSVLNKERILSPKMQGLFMFHKVLSTLAFFLFFLAIRNKFKIK